VAGTIKSMQRPERASALMYMRYKGNAGVQPYLLFFQAESRLDNCLVGCQLHPFLAQLLCLQLHSASG